MENSAAESGLEASSTDPESTSADSPNVTPPRTAPLPSTTAPPTPARHNLNTRISHWIHAVAVGYLVVSGVHIFLDFPELYWGKVGFEGHEAAFKLSDWGMSWDEAGAIGNRRWGRNSHFMWAWIFVINGLAYGIWNLWNRHFRKNVIPRRDELTGEHIKSELGDHLRFRVHDGAKGYGTLQKLAYTFVIFGLAPFFVISGFAQMPAFTAIAPWMIDMFGGRQTARTLQVVAMLVLLLFVIVHVFQVFLAGPINEIRAMVTGRYALPKDEER